MKEHVIKHFELIFSNVKFPDGNFEDKIARRQQAVQFLGKGDRFIYIQEGKQLSSPFQSGILMRVLNVLFSGPKPRFPNVLRRQSSISRAMLALACVLVSFLGAEKYPGIEFGMEIFPGRAKYLFSNYILTQVEFLLTPEKLPPKFQESIFAPKYREWEVKIAKLELHLNYKDLLDKVVKAVQSSESSRLTSVVDVSKVEAPRMTVDLPEDDEY